MTIIKDIFYQHTTLPLDIIKLILEYLKCSLCNNLAEDSCLFCNQCFCEDCYSPFYNVCICYKCTTLLF